MVSYRFLRFRAREAAFSDLADRLAQISPNLSHLSVLGAALLTRKSTRVPLGACLRNFPSQAGLGLWEDLLAAFARGSAPMGLWTTRPNFPFMSHSAKSFKINKSAANHANVFYKVFQDVPFPILFADLDKLQTAIGRRKKGRERSYCTFKIDVPKNKRAVFVSSLRGLLLKIEIPIGISKLFASSTPIAKLGCVPQPLAITGTKLSFSLKVGDDQLVWEAQFLNLIFLYKCLSEGEIDVRLRMLESSGFAAENHNLLSEYPRQLPTRFHYAAASLGAWIGGAMNVQYFACYAAIRQIHHPALNLAYSAKIGYDQIDAEKLVKSGIIALPASLVCPLFEAQGTSHVLGSICVDESNLSNPPAPSFFASQNIESKEALPGFISDQYYRAPFRARRFAGYGFYGTNDVTRDHYDEFYASLTPCSIIRCKHYCAPVIEVRDIDQLRALTSKIPVHNPGGVFYRGQERLFTLDRDPAVRQLLFADSCSVEPSLTTSASREKEYDYERLHFALRFFLEQQVLKRGGESVLERWRAQSILPDCKLDSAILALAQHYGLPSYGLDVTESDDVALWFATNRYTPGNTGKCACYRKLRAEDWPTDPKMWPVIFACQCVTQSISQSLHDCHELADFGFEAKRPHLQRARFFQGGHSDHQNRLAETVVCVFRLAPGDYTTKASFESLFPPPSDDPAYKIMLEFAATPQFGSIWGHYVNRFHQ